jgi:hypothetical protein
LRCSRCSTLFNAATFLVDKAFTTGLCWRGHWRLRFWYSGLFIHRAAPAQEKRDLIVGVCILAFVMFAARLACQLFAGRRPCWSAPCHTASANVCLIIPG